MDEFTRRYMQAGQTSVANFLIDHFQEVGMTTDQLLVYLQLKRWLDRGDYLPESDVLARNLGWDTKRVFEVLHEMIAQKLMTINTVTNDQGRKVDRYDFQLLDEKLSQVPDQSSPTVTPTSAATTSADQQPAAPAASSRATVFNQIETEFGRTLSPIEMETVSQWLDEDHYRPELVQLALREAVLNQAYSLKYMDRILLNWEKKHLTSAAQVQREREKQAPRRNTKTNEPNQPSQPHFDFKIYKLTDD
ncbi:DnaD domain-containing protein [Levilactobacillus suantsaii]|uniref:DnaD domain protein n=1 Tax=Levilactobacillus suantsaii TaxID=2292255 RepID=A0A4V1LFI0_9LACO|nr:DnaD domain protein [Levilactobacillus suantsaii]QMU07720.1 DnaD domain protein [Levilactobacillus suantsaii]RXI79349.1 DnaD domain protein [Levilactobacillus suantsaii]